MKKMKRLKKTIQNKIYAPWDIINGNEISGQLVSYIFDELDCYDDSIFNMFIRWPIEETLRDHIIPTSP